MPLISRAFAVTILPAIPTGGCMRRQTQRSLGLVPLVLSLVSVCAAVSHAQTYLPGAKFGVNDDYFIGFYYGQEGAAMQDAADAHLGVVRMPIDWFQLQPSAPVGGNFLGSLDNTAWQMLSEKIDAARARNLSVYATLVFPPQWATGVPASTSQCGEPPFHACNNGDVPFYCLPQVHGDRAECQGGHAVSEAAVRQFVSYAVSRFKGRIKYWGFANEPYDLTFWTGDGPKTGDTRTTPQLISNMLRPGYEEAKRADPGVIIVGPDEIATNNYCYLLQNANPYFDIISFHAYDTWGHMTFEQRLDDMKGCIDAYGQGKPVWVTEFGVESVYNQQWTVDAQSSALQSQMTSIINRPWIKRALIHRLRGDAPSPGSDDGITQTNVGRKQPTYNTVAGIAATASNWRPQASINLSYPTQYITDATGGPNYDDYVLIANSTGTGTTARLTFVFPDGSGQVNDYPVAANSRYTVRLPDVPGVAGEGPISVVVQSLNTSVPLMAEHSTYWGAGYAGGRSTEGVSANPTWYFAEGNAASGDVFKEWLTVFNPNSQPINVQFDFLRSSGDPAVITRTVRIMEGPGRVRIHVNDLIPDGITEHATTISGFFDNGTPANITAERTMEWFQDSRDGHSSPGVPNPNTFWLFAEGYKGGAYATYIPISNPTNSDADVWCTFFNEAGTIDYWHQVIPAKRRATAVAPASYPTGSFAVNVISVNGVGVVAERVMYWNTSTATWAGGSAGVGFPWWQAGTHWLAPEGSTNTFFHTYILVANNSYADAHLTVRFLKTDGTVTTTYVTVPQIRRGTIDTAQYVSGDFSTDVTSDVPIVVERSMYWGAEFYGGHITMARPVP
jgi:hypothetical protein